MTSGVIRKAVYGVLAGTLAIHGFLFWKERALIAKGYPDFTIFYSAGLMIRQGQGHRLYDDALQDRVQRSFAPNVEIRQGPLPYMHPPFEALLFAPLTLLPYLGAYIVWNLLNLGMLSLVPRVLRPHIAILNTQPLALWILALLAFFPVFSALLQGQDVILLLLLQSLAFAGLKRGSDFLSGCWLGLGSFKIHLILPLILIILLGWKRPKVFLGFLAIFSFLGAISIGILGWPQALHYPVYLLHLERVGANGAIVANVVPNLRGLIEGWGVSEHLGEKLQVVAFTLSVALLVWVIVESRRFASRQIDLHFALATTASVLVSYHAFASDLILLVIPLLVAISCYLQAGVSFPRDLSFLAPVGILILTPIYVFLLFRVVHINLLAVVLLLWLFGIQQRIKGRAQSIPNG